MHFTSTSFVTSWHQRLLATGKRASARFSHHQGDHKGTSLLYTLAIACVILYLAVMVSSCSLPGQAQAQPPDPRLKLFHVLSARILTLDSQAEVDGTLINTGTYKYPFDVSLVATFYDLKGNVIGSAQGYAEDVWPGMTRPFQLLGQVDSSKYSRMVVTPVSLRERRYEKNIPTPPPVIP